MLMALRFEPSRFFLKGKVTPKILNFLVSPYLDECLLSFDGCPINIPQTVAMDNNS